MKRLIVLLPMVLVGCATTQGLGGLGADLLSAALNQKCQSEVKAHPYYAYASVLMSESQKAQITSQVCGCVSKQAPKMLSPNEALTIATDAQQRPAIITKVVKGSLQACAAEWFSR